MSEQPASAHPAPCDGAAPAASGSDASDAADALAERWSFGGATTITTSTSVITPVALIAGADHGLLYARLATPDGGMPAPPRPWRVPAPARPFMRWLRRMRAREFARTMRAMMSSVDELSVVDSSGTAYALQHVGSSGGRGLAGKPLGPMSMRLRLEPAPARDIGWLEVRSPDGTTTRLEASPRALARAGQLTAMPASQSERTLWDLLRGLLRDGLFAARKVPDDRLSQRCAAALANAAEIQRSGDLDPASQLPDLLRRLCAVLTGQRPAASLPAGWRRILDAAALADGPSVHLDFGTTLPAIDGVSVRVDSLASVAGSWRLYLRAAPGWWQSSEDGRRRWSRVNVDAEDDRGNIYLSTFTGGAGRYREDELDLEFLPCLDPLASGVTLTFRGQRERLAVDLQLGPVAAS